MVEPEVGAAAPAASVDDDDDAAADEDEEAAADDDDYAAADEPAVPMDKDAAYKEPAASMDLEAVYENAPADALERLMGTDAADGMPAAASDDDARAGLPRIVGGTNVGYASVLLDGADEAVNSSRVRPRRPTERHPRQPRRPRVPLQQPQSRPSSKGKRSQATKKSAFEQGLLRAAEAASMEPAKVDVSAVEESEDDGISAGSLTM